MQITPLKFVSVGYGNAVCANRVVAVMLPGSAAGKRRLKQAKDTDTHLDMTFGRALKSLLLLDDGTVLGCGLKPRTIMPRLMDADTEAAQDEDAPDSEQAVEHDATS